MSFEDKKATKVNVAAGFGHKSMVGGVNFRSVRHCNILSSAVGRSENPGGSSNVVGMIFLPG